MWRSSFLSSFPFYFLFCFLIVEIRLNGKTWLCLVFGFHSLFYMRRFGRFCLKWGF